MLPTSDHVTALQELVAAGESGDETRIARAFAAANTLLTGGERDEPDGKRTPSALERGIGGGDIEVNVGHTDDGFVVMRFDHLIQWVRWDPVTAIAIAEAMITAAQAAAPIWMPKKQGLVGIPQGKK